MRIISGTHGGRRIQPPTNMPHTRPTTDIAKEGLFNILQNQLDFEKLTTLDLFGGTGCISYELASRGVPDLTIVEMDTKKFAIYNIMGCMLWVATMLVGGHFLQTLILKEFNFDLKEHLEVIVLGIVVITTFPVIWKVFFSKKKPEDTPAKN